MKTVFAAVMITLALAACRETDPADAPPVGRGVALDAGASPPHAANATTTTVESPVAVDDASSTRNLARPARADAYRRDLALARETVDTAWNRCGSEDGDETARCRDEAVVAYDVALDAARAAWGDDLDEQAATTPGVLDRRDDLAISQVTGIRG